MKQKFEDYVKENGVRPTARQFGRSTQWVVDRYDYTAVLKKLKSGKTKLLYINGPPKSERCFPIPEK